MVTIVSVTAMGGGQYQVQFSEPVTWTGLNTMEPDLLAHSPTDLTWNPIFFNSQVDAQTIGFEDEPDFIGDDLLVFLAQPQQLIAANPFQVAGPQAPIS